MSRVYHLFNRNPLAAPIRSRVRMKQSEHLNKDLHISCKATPLLTLPCCAMAVHHASMDWVTAHSSDQQNYSHHCQKMAQPKCLFEQSSVMVYEATCRLKSATLNLQTWNILYKLPSPLYHISIISHVWFRTTKCNNRARQTRFQSSKRSWWHTSCCCLSLAKCCGKVTPSVSTVPGE